MAALLGLRAVLYWWPVHLLGFAVAVWWCTRELWCSFLLGWLARTLTLKMGGNALRHGRSFFLGVIIGEATMVGLATFGSPLTGVRTGVVFLSH